MNCPKCGGSGKVADGNGAPVDCEDCGGTGQTSGLVLVGSFEGFEISKSEDSELWIRDIDFATDVGLNKPRNIRGVISGCVKDGAIFPHNPCAHSMGAQKGPQFRVVQELGTIGQGKGKYFPAYHLNREAVLMVAARLRTPKAIESTRRVMRIIMSIIDGDVQVAPAKAQDAIVDRQDIYLDRLTVAIDRLSTYSVENKEEIKLVKEEFKTVKGEVQIVKSEVQDLKTEIKSFRDEVRENVTVARKPVTDTTDKLHVSVCLHYYQGRCIHCRSTLIANPDGSKTPDYRTEHHVRRNRNGADETAPVCNACNIEFERHGGRVEFSLAVAEYHRLRKQFNGPLFGAK